MKFSAQEEYGLRCVLQLSRLGDGASTTISEIARLEGLTTPHVAKLMAILRKAELIVSTRGHEGGYSLARPARETRVADVLEALGGKLYDEEFCGRHSGLNAICTHAVDCSVRSLWQVLQGAIDDALASMTLADMLDKGTNVTLFDSPPRIKL